MVANHVPVRQIEGRPSNVTKKAPFELAVRQVIEIPLSTVTIAVALPPGAVSPEAGFIADTVA
jgi:hypothetical protein